MKRPLTVLVVAKRWLNPLSALIAATAVVMAVIWALSSRPIDPLRFDSPQNVLREPAVFHTNEPVVVEATFRNSHSAPITFRGVVNWRLVAIDGVIAHDFSVLQFAFSQSLEPGCTELVFENLPPVTVQAEIDRRFADGAERLRWVIYGDNVITEPEVGAQYLFETEPFVYVPDSAALPEFSETDDDTHC